MKNYNASNTCDECKINRLIPSETYKQYKDGKWTGKWLCRSCWNKDYQKKKYPNYNGGNYLRGNKPYYNRANTCRCGEKLVPGKALKEYNKEGNWTSEWICNKCWQKEYGNNFNSHHSIIKRLSNIRNDNLDPYSRTGKGYIFEQITCKARRIKNLNIINDNLNTPIDHSKDSEYGVLQTKGALYDSEKRQWLFNVRNLQRKEFDNLIVHCMDKDMKNVERTYIIPKEEAIKRNDIKIKKFPYFDIWYEKYRADRKLYNDSYHNLNEDDLKGLKKEELKLLIKSLQATKRV